MKKIILAVVYLVLYSVASTGSPLKPVRLDSPRSTMSSYLQAMEDYNQGRKTKNKELTERINDAIRTFNLEQTPILGKNETGRKTAILLKEVIDRVITIDLDKVPDDSTITSWRLKDTEIIIKKVKSGENEGHFLFSANTVERMPEFYRRVEKLPYINENFQGAGYKRPLQEIIIPEWAQDKFMGFKKFQWLGLFLTILIGFICKHITQFILRSLKKVTHKNIESLKYQILNALEKPSGLLANAIVWFLGLQALQFEGTTNTILTSFVQISFGISFIWATYRLSDIVTGILSRMAQKTESELDDQLVPLLSKSLRVFIVVIGALVTIQNLGFNVMSLLAGLGLGGLAFALAAKDTAANLFGSIMILLDRPFKVGDWVVTSQGEGTIQEVGFRSTRLRTFYDSIISIPNSVLANEKIDNMGQRSYRRVRSILSLTYNTSPEKMEAFLEGVKNIIKANEFTRKDYFHVVFNSYGEFSLDVLVYYFLKVPDWSSELVEKQNIALEILRLAKEIDVQFAFPTQSINIEQLAESSPLPKKQLFSNQDLISKAKAFGPKGSQSSPSGRGIFIPPHKE